MFLSNENLQFAFLLPVAGERLLLIKKAWQKRDENLQHTITKSLQDYFLLFLHSHVKPYKPLSHLLRLMTPIVFNHALTTSVKKCLPYLGEKWEEMDKFLAELLKTTLLITNLWNQYTTDREILAVKTFSPVAKVAKIKRVKFFLLIGHVAKIKHANTSYAKKCYVKISRSTVFMNCQ